MKSLKVVFTIAALATSGFVMAEGGGDRTFARMEQARKLSIDATEVTQKQSDSLTVSEVKSDAIKGGKYWQQRYA